MRIGDAASLSNKRDYDRFRRKRTSAAVIVSAEPGTRLRQRCQECGVKFRSTRRVERCPITTGCNGHTIVLCEIEI